MNSLFRILSLQVSRRSQNLINLVGSTISCHGVVPNKNFIKAKVTPKMSTHPD
jgi:hypothetical protein